MRGLIWKHYITSFEIAIATFEFAPAWKQDVTRSTETVQQPWKRIAISISTDGFWGDVEGPSANEIELAARNVVVAVNEAAQAVMDMFVGFLIMLSVLFLLSIFSQSYNSR